MYHNGTKTLLDNTNGNLEIRNSADDSDIIFQSDDGSGGTTAYFTIDGGSSVNKFHKALYNLDGVYHYFGTGYDLSIWHDATNWWQFNQGIQLDDNSRFVVGSSGDASFYHNGTLTYLENATGDLTIRNFSDRDWETAIVI